MLTAASLYIGFSAVWSFVWYIIQTLFVPVMVALVMVGIMFIPPLRRVRIQYVERNAGTRPAEPSRALIVVVLSLFVFSVSMASGQARASFMLAHNPLVTVLTEGGLQAGMRLLVSAAGMTMLLDHDCTIIYVPLDNIYNITDITADKWSNCRTSESDSRLN